MQYKYYYNNLRKWGDEGGSEYIDKMIDELDTMDTALAKEDMEGVAESMKRIAPNLREFSKHVKNAYYRNAARINGKLLETMVVPKLEQGHVTVEEFSNYFDDTLQKAKDILMNLQNAVYDLMGALMDEINPDMEV